MRPIRTATSLLRPGAVALGAICILASGGCALFRNRPSQANIELRKQNQALQEQVGVLTQEHTADVTALAAAARRVPTTQSLAPDRLARLFTTHGLSFGKLTSGADLKGGHRGDDAIKVYIAPTDEAGETLKAAGAFDVELVDLNTLQPTVAGHWTFPVQDAKSLWRGSFLENCYVLTCPFTGRPVHADLTLKVQFIDELTQAEFTAQEPIKVSLISATTPTTSP